MSAAAQSASQRVPVLLLKTKSTPTDAYEERFSQPHGLVVFEPHFVPVLQHRYISEGLSEVRKLLLKEVEDDPDGSYGGMIFTSQRAVEAFASLVENETANETWSHLQDVPIYSVGPATTRALKAISRVPRLQVFGEHTGNGQALSEFMLQHYRDWYRDRPSMPPLLFLVGEQRRDVIPKTLMDESLPSDRRIPVTEVEVYGTGVMESFADDFKRILRDKEANEAVWIVVFSPTGCGDMLEGLGFLDGDGRAKPQQPAEVQVKSRHFVATIGPTTKSFLEEKFGFTPNVCAAQPSPEGVWSSITDYMSI